MIRRAAPLALVALVTAATFLPVLEFGFLNWDDDAVITTNKALDSPGVVRWAFTTTHMEHYQPLSWLVWAGIKRSAGPAPSAFHAANLIAHVFCAVLLLVTARALLQRASSGTPVFQRDAIAAAAALLYAVHPLRAEVVAWVSALPYSLALALALLSVQAWLRTSSRQGTAWWIAALLLYIASLLARPAALGYPIVLVAIDVGVFSRSLRTSVSRVWPFALAALGAAGVEFAARGPAMSDTSVLYRLQSAVLAPFVYVWRSIAPARLTPLDLLPENPNAQPMLLVSAVLALIVVAAQFWRWRDQRPWLVAAAVAYLALLAPAATLVAGGLQQTADRYTYFPDIVLAIAVAVVGATWAKRQGSRRHITAIAASVAISVAALAARAALEPWRDSISLWSHATDVDPANHVAHYNLALALAAAGRTDEAADRYRRVLALQPSHAPAQRNLDRLDAARLEREGNELAARGDLRTAATRYARAVELDEQRTHAHAALGMALASQGHRADATAALRTAINQGVQDVEVSNTLALLLMEAGQPAEARAVLERALSVHQDDLGLAHNLARLLSTEPAFAATDAPLALRLANAVANATGGRDPRALDTLAAALAINGQMREAAETSKRAAALATAQGDHDMAVQINARGRAYRNPGR